VDTFDFHQVSDVCVGVCEMGQMGLIFVDRGINSEVLLTQQLLPVMHEICGDFIFQQHNAPARQVYETINLVERESSVSISTHLWPKQPDMNPVDGKI